MPFKYNADGTIATSGEGAQKLPIFIHADGREAPFDADTTVSNIGRLNGEAKSHREAKEAAELRLKSFEGIEDGAAALTALTTVKNLGAGELKTAAQVQEIKDAAAKSARESVEAATCAAADKEKVLTEQNSTLYEHIQSRCVAVDGDTWAGHAMTRIQRRERGGEGSNDKSLPSITGYSNPALAAAGRKSEMAFSASADDRRFLSRRSMPAAKRYRVSTTASWSATSLASDGDMVISNSFADPAACEMQPVPASAPLKAPIIVFSNGYSRSASMRSIRPAALAWIRRDPISWPKVPVKSMRTSATRLCGCSSDNNLLAVL